MFDSESVEIAKSHLVAEAVVDQACMVASDQCLYWLKHLDQVEFVISPLAINTSDNGDVIASASVEIMRLNIDFKQLRRTNVPYLVALINSDKLGWSQKQSILEEL
jgi:hypothetical protein